MSSRNFMAVRRRSPAGRGPGRGPPGAAACAPTAAQLPVALNTASGIAEVELVQAPLANAAFARHRACTAVDRVDLQPAQLLAAQLEVIHDDVERRQAVGLLLEQGLHGVGGRRGDRQPREPGIQPAGTRAGGLAVLHIAVEFVGVEVAPPELALARATDDHVMQDAAFHA